MSESLALNFHNTQVLITSDRPALLDGIKLILQRYKVDQPGTADLHINVTDAGSFWGTNGRPKDMDTLLGKMQQIGRRVFVRNGEVFVRQFVAHPGLGAWYRQIDEPGDSGTVIDLIYDWETFSARSDPYRALHMLLGVFPIATYLAKKKNMFFLHGGAVSFEGRNIVFCGLQGVGKTTLLLRMLRNPKSLFLSDNIYFHDAERLYACPETIRIDDKGLALIEPPADLLIDTGLDTDLGRKMYLANPTRSMENCIPDVFIVPRFDPDRSNIVRVKEDVINLLMGFGELALELSDFNQWSAPFLLFDGSFGTKRLAALRALLENKPIYHLSIKKGDHPDTLVELIRSVAGR